MNAEDGHFERAQDGTLKLTAWEIRARMAANAEFRRQHGRRTWPEIEKWEKDRRRANRMRERRWSALAMSSTVDRVRQQDRIEKEVYARYGLNDPKRLKVLQAERKERAKCYSRILGNCRRKIGKEKDRETVDVEEAASAEIQRFLAAHGIFGVSKQGLGQLSRYIREDVCRGNRMNPLIRDTDLRHILAKVEKLTGEDIAESVFLAYSPGMRAHVEELAKETAVAEKIEQSEARRRVLERVRFVAVFEGNIRYLIQSVSRCVHDERDEELFRLVAPDVATRAEIETRLETARRENAIKREGMKAAAPAEGGRLFNAAEYGTQQDIKRMILGDGKKASRRKLWEANRERIEKEIPPVILPGGKRPEYHLPSVREWFDRNKIAVQS